MASILDAEHLGFRVDMPDVSEEQCSEPQSKFTTTSAIRALADQAHLAARLGRYDRQIAHAALPPEVVHGDEVHSRLTALRVICGSRTEQNTLLPQVEAADTMAQEALDALRQHNMGKVTLKPGN